MCLDKHCIVGHARREFRNVDNRMPVVSKALDDGALDAFIADEVQAAVSAMG